MTYHAKEGVAWLIGILFFVGFAALVVWRAENTDDARDNCGALGAVAVREYNGSGYVCVEVARP
jgi:histidine ammonia-lyase